MKRMIWFSGQIWMNEKMYEELFLCVCGTVEILLYRVIFEIFIIVVALNVK